MSQKQPKEKIIPIHKDKLGRTLAINDFVAYPHSNALAIGKITKLNPKMVKVLEVGTTTRYRRGEYNKYPDDTVRIEGSEVTFYILKNSA